MNEWELDLRITNEACPFRDENNFCRAYSNWCAHEICETMVDMRPITAEWLESVGAIITPGGCAKFVISNEIDLTFEPGSGVLLYVEEPDWSCATVNLPHIQTRHQFSKLYRLLSGRELGE